MYVLPRRPPSAGGIPERVVAEPVHSVQDLLRQLAQTDVVVATRFHNVLLALLVEKPVISISYNQKNDDLMAEMGLGAFCQPIDELDVERLHDQFLALAWPLPARSGRRSPRKLCGIGSCWTSSMNELSNLSAQPGKPSFADYGGAQQVPSADRNARWQRSWRELYPICRSITGDGVRAIVAHAPKRRTATTSRSGQRDAGFRLDRSR